MNSAWLTLMTLTAAHQDCLLHQSANAGITGAQTHREKSERAMNQEILDTLTVMNPL